MFGKHIPILLIEADHILSNVMFSSSSVLKSDTPLIYKLI